MPPYKNEPTYNRFNLLGSNNVGNNNWNVTSKAIENLLGNTYGKISPSNRSSKPKDNSSKRKLDSEKYLKTLIKDYNDSIKAANPTISQRVGESFQAPLRYLGNPLKIVGDAVDVIAPGQQSIPTTRNEIYNGRTGGSQLNEIPINAFNAASLIYNPVGTMTGHLIGAIDDNVGKYVNNTLGTKLGANPSEVANNTVSRSMVKDWGVSEHAGGVRDINQAYNSIVNGKYVDAGINTAFGLSGLIEIPDNLKNAPGFKYLNAVDNIVESVKKYGNLYDALGGTEGIKELSDNNLKKQFANGGELGNKNIAIKDATMNTNNKKTYASRANALIKKYSRASFDKTERDELESALAALAQEQEAYKRANGIGEYSPENIQAQQMQQQAGQAGQQVIPSGQVQQFDGISGTSMLSGKDVFDYNDYNVILNNLYKPAVVDNANMIGSTWESTKIRGKSSGIPISSTYHPLFGSGNNSSSASQATSITPDDKHMIDGNIVDFYARAKDPDPILGNGKFGMYRSNDFSLPLNSEALLPPTKINTNPIAPIETPESVIGQTQGILPSVLAGGVGMLGNIGMALATKPMKYNRSYGAAQISLAKERERLSRAMNTERSIAINNLKTSGNRGAYMAGVGAVSSGVGQGTASGMSDSYTREAMTNLQQQERANELNRQVDLMNYQAKVQADQDRKAYIANAINAGIGAGTDINKILGQNSLIESLGSTNYMVSPSATSAARDLWRGRVIKGKVRPTK